MRSPASRFPISIPHIISSLSYISYSSSTFHPQVIGHIPPASSALPLAVWRSLSASFHRCTRRQIATWVHPQCLPSTWHGYLLGHLRVLLKPIRLGLLWSVSYMKVTSNPRTLGSPQDCGKKMAKMSSIFSPSTYYLLFFLTITFTFQPRS